MRKLHMEPNGWSDLAQHLTIEPQGGRWTGRNARNGRMHNQRFGLRSWLGAATR